MHQTIILRILLFSSALITVISTHGQPKDRSAFMDARYLTTEYPSNIPIGNADVKTILKIYLGKDFTLASIQANPFLNGFFTDERQEIKEGGEVIRRKKVIALATQPVGDLDVTNIADGVARFLIKRGKQELDLAFFGRMKIFFDKHEEFKVLFPATCEFLSNMAAYQYAELLQSLREAFNKDLSNLIIDLNQLMETEKYQNLLKNLPEVRLAIRTAEIAYQLSQSNHSITPDSIIFQLASFPEWTSMNSNLGTSWKILEIISQSLRETNGKDVWISLSDFNSYLVQDTRTLHIYLGLILAQVKDLSFTNGSTKVYIKKFLTDKLSSNINQITDLVENFVVLANDVDRTIEDSKSKQGSKTLTNDDYYTYISKAINIAEYGFKVADLINPGTSSGDAYIFIAKNANDLYKNIYTKNYNNAVMNLYSILDMVFNHEGDLVAKKLAEPSNTSTQNTDLNAADEAGGFPDEKTIEAVLKYGNLIASVVKAGTPDDVETAIESAVLPAGSSSIKKNTSWNLALNAYVGYYTGPRLNKMVDGWNNNSGVTAPIGIAFSKSIGKCGNFNLGSITAYVPLINIGSIVDYRLNDSANAITQQIQLGNIFSPGLYFVYGLFAQLPLSIGYGWQYGPRIFKVASDQNKLTDTPGWRHNWIFTIDIPIANFVTINKLHKNK
jgi:hypothetical protein